MRILIADDHVAVRKGVCEILKNGFSDLTCDEATNGQDAIRLAAENPPDLIILDVNMPIMGGFEAAIAIKRRLPSVPILFFTMHTGDGIAVEARKVGVDGYITKVEAGETLVKAVNALLKGQKHFPA
jgi:DNA-binding NarL/FixJ family response regulator